MVRQPLGAPRYRSNTSKRKLPLIKTNRTSSVRTVHRESVESLLKGRELSSLSTTSRVPGNPGACYLEAPGTKGVVIPVHLHAGISLSIAKWRSDASKLLGYLAWIISL